MLMVKDNGMDFEPIETGLQQAVCSHVIDLGVQHSELYGDKAQVALCFELAQKMKDGRPFMLSKIYTRSLNSKATLTKDLESWRGKKFTAEEIKGFDLDVLKGHNCFLNLTEKEKDNRIYAQISAIIKVSNGTVPIKPLGQPAPEWLVKKAAEGKEREARMLAEQTGNVAGETRPFPPLDEESPF